MIKGINDDVFCNICNIYNIYKLYILEILKVTEARQSRSQCRAAQRREIWLAGTHESENTALHTTTTHALLTTTHA